MRTTLLSLLVALLSSAPLFVEAQLPETNVADELSDCEAALGTPGTGEYEVVISLSGIAVYDRKDTDGFINVRMPNAVTGLPPITDPGPPPFFVRNQIEPHIAYILADVASAALLDPERLHPAFREGSCYVYYMLRGDTITVADGNVPLTSPNSPLCVTDAIDTNLCPSDKTRGSLRWLPKLKTILTGANVAPLPDYFNDPPEPKFVSGVAHVDRGYLQTVVTSPAKVWAFKKNSSAPEQMQQAIAQEVRWHMRAKGNPFVLQLTRKDGTRTDLKFVAPATGQTLSLFIANNPPNETGPLTGAGHDQDDHFRLYYTLLSGVDPKEGPLPFKSEIVPGCDTSEKPTLLKCKPGCPQDNDPNCKPAVAVSGGAGHAAMPGMTGLQPVPSGLNCGGTQWP